LLQNAQEPENQPASSAGIAIQQTEETAPLSDADIEARHTAYIEERKHLIESEHKYAENFDKAALTIGTGAMALSIGFVKDLAPSPAPWSVPFLCFGWAFFAWSVLSGLFAVLTAQKAFRRQVQILDDQYAEDCGHEPKLSDRSNPFSLKTDILNERTVRAIVAGAVFIAIFTAWNVTAKALTKQPNNNEQQIQSKSNESDPGAKGPEFRDAPLKAGPQAVEQRRQEQSAQQGRRQEVSKKGSSGNFHNKSATPHSRPVSKPPSSAGNQGSASSNGSQGGATGGSGQGGGSGQNGGANQGGSGSASGQAGQG
jgi:hypothetical protein